MTQGDISNSIILSDRAAHVTRTNIRGGVGATTIFTPAADGLFDVAITHRSTVAAAGSVTLNITYTDENGAQSDQPVGTLSLTSKNHIEKSHQIFAKSTGAVGYSVTSSGASGASRWNLDIDIRKAF